MSTQDPMVRPPAIQKAFLEIAEAAQSKQRLARAATEFREALNALEDAMRVVHAGAIKNRIVIQAMTRIDAVSTRRREMRLEALEQEISAALDAAWKEVP